MNEDFPSEYGKILKRAFEKLERSIERSHFLKNELLNLSPHYREFVSLETGILPTSVILLRSEIAVIELLSRANGRSLSVDQLSDFAYLRTLVSVHSSLIEGLGTSAEHKNAWKSTSATGLFTLILYNSFIEIYKRLLQKQP